MINVLDTKSLVEKGQGDGLVMFTCYVHPEIEFYLLRDLPSDGSPPTPADSGGYARDWQAPGIGSERNLVYAGQWLLLAVGALGAAVTITIRTLRRRP